MTKNDMLIQSIEQYKEMYIRTRAEFERLVTVRAASSLFVRAAPGCMRPTVRARPSARRREPR